MSTIQRLLLLISITALLSSQALAQRNKSGSATLADQIILVSNYSDLNVNLEKETLTTSQLLENNVRGFIIHLEVDADSSIVKMILPTKETVRLSLFLSTIGNFLDLHPDDVIFLFTDYNFPFFYLENELRNNQLYERIFIKDADDNWPSTANMTDKGERLVCFNMQRNQDSSPGFCYIWDHAVEPQFSTAIEPEFQGSYLRGRPSNPLMFFTGYNLPRDTTGIEIPFRIQNVTENPFLISHLINLWGKTGKKPTFIIINRFNSVFNGIAQNLNTHNSISGDITYDLKPLSMVSWEGDNQSITSGHYSFPFLAGEDIYLKPVKPGFRFIPDKISINNVKNNLVQNFIAIPLDLEERLVAYLPFENDCNDKSNSQNHGQNIGITFAKDTERGNVAFFKDKTFIKLPNAETLHLHNHDFTVSTWIKLVQPPSERRDITILGSEEVTYRQGLHLQLRELSPYFGFFANDLIGDTKVKYNEWVHIVWRYTKNTGEQAIFINGKPNKITSKHPSFMGRGDIFIGKSIQMHNFMNGYMDDFAIWDRPLGNEEIWRLYQDVMPLLQPSTSQRTGYLFYLIFAPVLLFFSYITWRRIKKKRSSHSIVPQHKEELPKPVSNIPESNLIRLFGEFQVIGRDGVDITILLTPKVRQLFILLLLFSNKNRKGISSEEINHMLWYGHTKKNATNNRGVNMNKLRQVLTMIDGIRIENQMENWTISIDSNILFCDYCEVLALLKNKSVINNPASLASFFMIVERGPLLMDSDEEWMDEFKGFMSSEVIDTLLKYSTFLSQANDRQTILRICDLIFMGDPFNEEALELKINTLLKNNQSNQARYTYQWFCENFEKDLGTHYNQSFEQITAKK